MAEQQDSTRLTLSHLRAWRLRRAWSQEDLSRAAGVSVSTIIRAEQGSRVNFITIHRLAQALGISNEQLLAGEGS